MPIIQSRMDPHELASELKLLEHMWTTDKDSWVLVTDDASEGYFIFNQVESAACLIEDDEVYEVVIRNMLKAGVPVRSSLREGGPPA